MQFYRDFEIWQIGNRFAEGFKQRSFFFAQFQNGTEYVNEISPISSQNLSQMSHKYLYLRFLVKISDILYNATFKSSDWNKNLFL